MIEDELVLGEPTNFVRWMLIGWLCMGAWYLHSDWREYRLVLQKGSALNSD